MQLELLEKLSDENLTEAYLGRLTVDGERELVTARRLLKQVTDIPGVIDGLSDVSAEMKSLEHENLLRHLGFAEAGGHYYWITERVDGFDLATAITRLSSREVHINPVRSLQIGLDFLKGLNTLHRKELLHTGLSPDYVLLGYDGVSRLDGIGFESTLLAIKDLKQKSRRLRSEYLAPEIIQGRNPAPQSDVFSAAAILYTLLTGTPPVEKEGSGAGMSVRHSTIELPSKLDRTLPFSCDAIFLKALSNAPSQRHESVDSFMAAIKRLRAAMLKGSDEGRAGVGDFVQNLFPNEAIVPGKPGSIDKPALGEGFRLTMLLGASKQAPDEHKPAPVQAIPKPKSRKVDDDALARVAAWEAAFGQAGAPAEKKASERAGPPPLKGRTSSSRPPPVPMDKKTTPVADSVVVDWLGLGEEKESEDTEEVRPGKVPAIEEPVPTPPPAPPVPSMFEGEPEQAPAETPKPVHETNIPTLVVDSEEEEQTEPEKPTEKMLTEKKADPGDETAKKNTPPHDPQQMPQAVEPPDEQVPFHWKKFTRKNLAVLVVVAVVAVVALLVIIWPQEEGTSDDEAGATSISFLSIHTHQPAKVTLDGELLPGTTPVKNKLLRAGKHRLMVDALDGTRLMDETITLQAGEHKDIRVVVAAAPSQTEPPGEEVKPEKPAGKKKKRTKKRRVRRKRRKTRK